MKIIHLRDEAEVRKLTNDPNCLVVLDFSAKWCGPCKRLYPLYEKFASEFPTDRRDVAFCHIDVDEMEAFAQINKITSLPTMMFVKGDTVVETFVGADFNKFKRVFSQCMDPSSASSAPSSSAPSQTSTKETRS